eukprot:TRINITY_DN60216_c0_g1_i1.p1 TRINITY_DN60216_c0_g1~~TRINITY_DN60216_c0_g1_i1.p1  ORF type:complete len:416 (+),score=98.36 TRINITY_DN60216_c0_g1_i1:94-1248(+)
MTAATMAGRPRPLPLVAEQSPGPMIKVSTTHGNRWFVAGCSACFADAEAAGHVARALRVGAAAAQQRAAVQGRVTQPPPAARSVGPLPPLPEVPAAAARARAARQAGLVITPFRETNALGAAISGLTDWTSGFAEWRRRAVKQLPPDWALQLKPPAPTPYDVAVAAQRGTLAVARAAYAGELRGAPALWQAPMLRSVAERVRSFVPPALTSRQQWEDQRAAATRIQAAWRAVLAQRETNAKRRDRNARRRKHAAATTIQSGWRARDGRARAAERRVEREAVRKRHSAATRIQSQWRARAARHTTAGRRLDRAALRIQSAWRSGSARQEAVRRRRRTVAVCCIQRAWRQRNARREVQRRRTAKEKRDKEAADARKAAGGGKKRRK